jgi:hypothetical protein
MSCNGARKTLTLASWHDYVRKMIRYANASRANVGCRWPSMAMEMEVGSVHPSVRWVSPITFGMREWPMPR